MEGCFDVFFNHQMAANDWGDLWLLITFLGLFLDKRTCLGVKIGVPLFTIGFLIENYKELG